MILIFTLLLMAICYLDGIIGAKAFEHQLKVQYWISDLNKFSIVAESQPHALSNIFYLL